MGLGVPFNIASYALLTRMVAQVSRYVNTQFISSQMMSHV